MGLHLIRCKCPVSVMWENLASCRDANQAGIIWTGWKGALRDQQKERLPWLSPRFSSQVQACFLRSAIWTPLLPDPLANPLDLSRIPSVPSCWTSHLLCPTVCSVQDLAPYSDCYLLILGFCVPHLCTGVLVLASGSGESHSSSAKAPAYSVGYPRHRQRDHGL